jgi:hypothetical protein
MEPRLYPVFWLFRRRILNLPSAQNQFEEAEWLLEAPSEMARREFRIRGNIVESQ